MSSNQSSADRFNRVVNWLESQNAKDEAITRARPAWWQAAKVVLGAYCVACGVNIGMQADSIGGYAIAAVFAGAALALTVEGAKYLRERWVARRGAH